MTLALFDLDNTLLSADSDYLWGQFLVDRGLVDAATYEERNKEFYQQYVSGVLDIHEFCAFAFAPLASRDMETLASLHKEFMTDYISDAMSNTARALIAQHKAMDHTLMVITATNSFVTRPIVEAYGIDTLIATEPKIVEGRYTTEIDGIPSFREGKVTRLNAWMADNDANLDGSYFYSDSSNDLPLLELVDHPIAVDPDEKLTAVAKERGWDIISLIDDA